MPKTNHSTHLINQAIALYGGTFDPIHYGHLRPVEALSGLIGLKEVIWLPNNIPPHRPQPEASSQQRLEMVRLALEPYSSFKVDTRELEKPTPSYTIETLRDFRKEIGNKQPLAFIIGQDSLLSINTWHQWDQLLNVCHLLVCARPGYQTHFESTQMQTWLTKHQTHQQEDIHCLPTGKIFLADTPLYNISATDIRARHKAGLDCHDLLPNSVEDYIRQQQLYK
ncbi:MULTISPECIES: nicotinate-nucleotide adenylyltransferase [Proteus]|uniref:nicotinate-nucleotide adenylyltransferase n=1 Tax=Proteus TaxID=583 RepID=UPI000BFCDE4F|nr:MULTISPECIES: nicotinate-nucleotide adenylyltransferase [Proteus]ATN01396.1 nicotinic acid mononucleotide adenylyltransferase [Proteus vulgaris]MBG2837424.1 nicotinate-nucleotide adenylyltransferase [Proteus terrae subsp. cibarius]MBG2869621.1 nicotinate-nucleotide adenylyltransferase [Proteus terrae subsp. cibarius]MCO7048925.1 nicotinate-nucleotide adenylyltransferase [Proteus terrae]MCS6713002.1 nicotinate-nucleotide adenylyltransferase [Proteus terrae]